MKWRFYPLKFELIRIFLNCFSLIGYIIGCLNLYTVLENPLDTPLLNLKSSSSENSCIYFVIRFTKASYYNKKANLNYLSQMHLRTGNSVHGKLETFSAETLIEPIRKTKVLNESFNQFVYKFYLQSILILEEYLLKRWNANLIMPLDVFWSIL